jgi:hypothetical protein
MEIKFAPMINDLECEVRYIKKIHSFLTKELDDDYNLIIARINNGKDYQMYKEIIPRDKRNILILVSDETGTIPSMNSIEKVFRTYNHKRLYDMKRIFPIPCGYSTAFGYEFNTDIYESKDDCKSLQDREYDIFFSGQLTTTNRQQMFMSANKLNFKKLINTTTQFASGYKLSDYYSYLGNSKIALVPNGVAIPESFRYFEAFERNCIVITTYPKNDESFNHWYYEKSPAIFLKDWSQLNETLVNGLLSRLDYYDIENKKYFNQNISPEAVANYMLDKIKKII